MKNFIFLFLFLNLFIAPTIAKAQVDTGGCRFQVDDTTEEEPLVWAEQMPEFPGGEVGLKTYIAEHTKYPALAAKNGIQGTVYVRFVTKKDGSIGEVQVTRGVDSLLDKEALRVVKSLPKFKPGVQGGRPVNVWFYIPISFKLTKNK